MIKRSICCHNTAIFHSFIQLINSYSRISTCLTTLNQSILKTTNNQVNSQPCHWHKTATTLSSGFPCSSLPSSSTGMALERPLCEWNLNNIKSTQIRQPIKVQLVLVVYFILLSQRHQHHKLPCEHQVVTNVLLQLFYLNSQLPSNSNIESISYLSILPIPSEFGFDGNW